MTTPLAVLMVEDSDIDAQFILRLLRKAGYEITFKVVETAERMRDALQQTAWDLVISDYSLPQFDGPAALRVLQETSSDMPFIVVSGVIGEETAVAMMRAGANDYLVKSQLARLAPAVARELRDADTRRARRRAEEDLRHSASDLRALGAHLHTVREEERATLSRELHDDLGQHLTALQFDLMSVDRHLQAAGGPDLALLRDRIAGMVPLVERLIEQTQTICTALRPGLLDDLGLAAAIEWQTEDLARRTGLTFTLSLPSDDNTMDRNAALALFRIVQEALTNVVRHAQATRVDIGLRTVGSALELEVGDNGRGFAPELTAGPKALGLLGMRERAGAFGGSVEFLSAPGKGATVRVRMPSGARPAEHGEGA